MFKKILIANRGEIAVRINATCHEMGIRTVAVYSEADREAMHARVADEAYAIGPAPATQSYLQIETIIDIARKSGAQAIHPGYGFLSENADFAAACEQAGIVFIGPSAAAMRLMGSKIAAKALALSVGAPVVPGYNGESQDTTVLYNAAEHIGFPLLIKAAAGGGGKGMRIVNNANEFAEQLAGAQREAQASFGDATVFLERLILQPRHVEIQILGDRYGHLIHLGERECSIQRRHQKIVEESPSVALTPELRAEMGAAAVRIARAANYVNAGTIEFILDADKHFYFLEMNTRLQVEHPVTELVTGLDLVRHQLDIAAGEPLAPTQEQVSQRGHAIEVRIYAEDPAHNFLPSTGTIDRFIRPEGPGIRLDSGITDGDEITQYYDPMIAKLIVYGEDRSAAIARLQRALTESAILGVTTNISLLHAISTSPAFQAGQTHTGFLDEQKLLSASAVQHPLPQDALIAAALSTIQHEIDARGIQLQPERLQSIHATTYPWTLLGPWRMPGEARTLTYRYHNHDYKIAIKPLMTGQANIWEIQVDQQETEQITRTLASDSLIVFQRGAAQIHAHVQQYTGEVHVVLDGYTYRLQRRQPPDIATTAHAGGAIHTQKTLTAPMAGTIVKVNVHEGQVVEAHQVLVILSAMKMEHAITAPYEGKVQRIFYHEGDVVPGKVVLIELD